MVNNQFFTIGPDIYLSAIPTPQISQLTRLIYPMRDEYRHFNSNDLNLKV